MRQCVGVLLFVFKISPPPTHLSHIQVCTDCFQKLTGNNELEATYTKHHLWIARSLMVAVMQLRLLSLMSLSSCFVVLHVIIIN